MRNVHKTETREETRTTRGYTYDPSEGLPSDYPFSQNNNHGITNGGNSTTSTTRTSTTRTNNNSSNNNNTVSTFPSISDQPFDFDNFDLNNSNTTTTTSSIRSSILPGFCDKEPGKFSVNVQLSENIGPEDLKVSIKDHVMTIEAKKEQNSPDGTSRIYQEFSRKFTLPPNVDMRAVRTMLSPQGDLKIEAPLAAPTMKAIAAPSKSQRNSVTFKRDRDVPIKIGFL